MVCSAYLDGRAVGCIITASGWQAFGTTLTSLRTIIHALRGWPTPLGVTLNPSTQALFDEAGQFSEERNARQVELLVQQVVDFARMRGVSTPKRAQLTLPR
jgi:FMN reductase